MITVEGRHFPNTLYAFTFAGIQADRMDRPVEVRVNGQWHATAHPESYVREHVYSENSPLGISAAAAEAA
jgi:hypothetical protein